MKQSNSELTVNCDVCGELPDRTILAKILKNNQSVESRLDEFFAGYEESRRLFDAVADVVNTLGAAELRVTRSQVAFYRRKPFAWLWMPGQYLRRQAAPLVLTLSRPDRDPSPRWKQIVEPYPGRFTHHLELYASDDIDDQVRDWLRDAWLAAV